MRVLMLFWVVVELLQIAVIGMLVVSYRNLQRRLDAGDHFSRRTPRSVTEE